MELLSFHRTSEMLPRAEPQGFVFLNPFLLLTSSS